MTEKCIADGGGWLEPAEPADGFAPEDLSTEQKMLGRAAEEFVAGEIAPRIDEIESGDHPALLGLLRKSAQLGLQGVDVPEAFGGMQLDAVSAMVLTEKAAAGGSFGIAGLDHGTFATLPIVYFGSGEQKARYLPAMAAGEKIGAFALTEPDAGSDALAGRTTARPDPAGDGCVLNGEKQFITNAAYADVFVVFARFEEQGWSAFIVDRDTPGLSVGEEEPKLGIKGSSTRSLVLEDVRVPESNRLFATGRGHVVAFDTLNVGRLRLGALCLGGAKQALKDAIGYAKTRIQFGRSLTEFGLIRSRIGEMTARIFTAEGMLYRSAALFARASEGFDPAGAEPDPGWIERLGKLAIEGAINKVFASRTLDFVTDQALQIYGGYGYTKHYPVERYYRDARIHRIFAGTNDICRLMTVDRLQKAARSLGLSSSNGVLPGDGPPDPGDPVSNAWQVLRLALRAAAPDFPDGLSRVPQEVRARIADLLIEIYALESVRMRTVRADGDLARAAGDLCTAACRRRIHRRATAICAAVLKGDRLTAAAGRLDALCATVPVDTTALRRAAADEVIGPGRYPAA